MAIKLVRRHPAAFSISAVATIAAVVLATIPNWHEPYDANLAVLTATLVAVIWYTFFSYCALHQVPAARVVFRLDHDRSVPRMIVAHVENQSPERSIRLRWRVLGRRNGANMDTGSELGAGDLTISLRPGEIRELNFRLAEAVGVPESNVGPAVQLGEPEDALLRAELVWVDDIRNGDYVGPDYYAVDVRNMAIRRYQVTDAAEEAWQAAGGSRLPRLAV